MAGLRKHTRLAAIVATPAVTAMAAPPAAFAWHAPASHVAVVDPQGDALKAGLLSLSPEEKLAIAGDRLGADPAVTKPAILAAEAPTTPITTDCRAAQTHSVAAVHSGQNCVVPHVQRSLAAVHTRSQHSVPQTQRRVAAVHHPKPNHERARAYTTGGNPCGPLTYIKPQ